MIIDQISGWATAIMAILTPCIMLWKMGKGYSVKVAAIEKRMVRIEDDIHKQQIDIESGKRERQIMLFGVLACLEGLKEQGCNGAVSDGIHSIKNFLFEEAHRGISKHE